MKNKGISKPAAHAGHAGHAAHAADAALATLAAHVVLWSATVFVIIHPCCSIRAAPSPESFPGLPR